MDSAALTSSVGCVNSLARQILPALAAREHWFDDADAQHLARLEFAMADDEGQEWLPAL